MLNRLLLNGLMYICVIICIFVFDQSFEKYIPALLLSIPVLLNLLNDSKRTSLARNFFLLTSIFLINYNLVIALLSLEIAILFELEWKGIKRHPFSLVPVFFISLILATITSRGIVDLLSYDNKVVIVYLVCFRLFCEMVNSHSTNLNLPTLYSISLIFASWWPWGSSILLGVILSIVILEYILVKINIKRPSEGLSKLLISLLVFALFPDNFEVVFIYFINLVLINVIKSNNQISKEEIIILISTQLFLIWNLTLNINTIELIGLVAFLLSSWPLFHFESSSIKETVFQKNLKSWARFLMCLLGVVFVAV